jgi:signal transduction histidine kinase
VDVFELLRSQAETWRAAACDANAVVVRDARGPVFVRGDRTRLAQATGNLLGNAFEHGGGRVELRVRAAPRDRIAIEVTDGGPGLPAPVGALTAGAQGGRGRRGRGLAIAAEVAARHGGRLSAAPSARGARLVLELPRASAPVGTDSGEAWEPAT